MRAKHACNSYKCISRLIVSGTRHYYAGWAWSCTNFVHSAGTARAQRAKRPPSQISPPTRSCRHREHLHSARAAQTVHMQHAVCPLSALCCTRAIITHVAHARCKHFFRSSLHTANQPQLNTNSVNCHRPFSKRWRWPINIPPQASGDNTNQEPGTTATDQIMSGRSY